MNTQSIPLAVFRDKYCAAVFANGVTGVEFMEQWIRTIATASSHTKISSATKLLIINEKDSSGADAVIEIPAYQDYQAIEFYNVFIKCIVTAELLSGNTIGILHNFKGTMKVITEAYEPAVGQVKRCHIDVTSDTCVGTTISCIWEPWLTIPQYQSIRKIITLVPAYHKAHMFN